MAQSSNKYILDMGWQVLLKDWELTAQDLLRHACLPLDLLNHKSPTVTADEYFQLWEALTHLLRDDPTFPLRLGQSISVEAFSPPIFACFCSANLNVALGRLKQYKSIVGPLRLDLTQNDQHTVVKFGGLPENGPAPRSIIAMELVFIVHVARLATRSQIIPQGVYINMILPGVDAYEDFFGIEIEQAKFNGVAFSAEDAKKPFLTANEAMWSVFEPELRKRIKDLGIDAGFRDRVRACLMEIPASGQYSMSDVAYRLAVSTRT